MNECKATTKAGGRCQAPATPTGFCFCHDPGKAEAVAAARRKGGEAHAKQAKAAAAAPDPDDEDNPWNLMTAFDCEACLADLAWRVSTGELPPRAGAVAVAAVRALLARFERGEK